MAIMLSLSVRSLEASEEIASEGDESGRTMGAAVRRAPKLIITSA